MVLTVVVDAGCCDPVCEGAGSDATELNDVKISPSSEFTELVELLDEFTEDCWLESVVGCDGIVVFVEVEELSDCKVKLEN